MLTENQEANFLKVLKGLRIHKANGTTHLRNREEAFTCVVDDTIEIARSVGISTRGMESIRYRMHKKLGLGKHQSIKTYLSELSMSF